MLACTTLQMAMVAAAVSAMKTVDSATISASVALRAAVQRVCRVSVQVCEQHSAFFAVLAAC